MQNVTILGITLQDRSLKETLGAAKRYLQSGALDVVTYINHDVLMDAERDINVRRFLSDATMTLWEDKEILHLVGISEAGRIKEVESRAFIREMLKNIAGHGACVSIAASDEDGLRHLRDELLRVQPELKIVHETVLCSSLTSVPENEINGINEHFPSMVIAKADYALQQSWLSQARPMINAGIWLAMPDGMQIEGLINVGMLRRIWHKLSFWIFSRRAKKAMEG